MKTARRVAIVSALLAFSPAHAGFFIDETLYPLFGKSNAGETGTDIPGDFSTTNLDFRTTLGVEISGFVIGGTLNFISESTDLAETSTDSGLEITQRSLEFGPTIGFVSGGFRLTGGYLLSGSRDTRLKAINSAGTVTGDLEQKDRGGMGFQVNVGYAFEVGSGFRIGPALVYRNMTYDKVSQVNHVSGATTPEVNYVTKAKESSFTPMITAVISFGGGSSY